MQKKSILSRVKSLLRLTVLFVAMWWVLSRMSWNDRVLGILPGQTTPQWLTLTTGKSEDTDLQFSIINPDNGESMSLLRTADDLNGIPQPQVINEPDKAKMQVTAGGKQKYVLGLDLSPDLTQVRRLLLSDGPSGPQAKWYAAADVPSYHLSIPHPRVQRGVLRMAREANPRYLLGALLVVPITIVITSFRWQKLMQALDIHLPMRRTFELNMVGLFWNSCMPGSTGGDVLKAYYVAKQTHHRTRAVMSVLVDRAIGLVALVILGGVMATMQWNNPLCRQVALGAVIILLCLFVGAVLFYVEPLRKYSGLDFVISKLPMQRQVEKAIETMHIFGKHWLLVILATVGSFPVHITIIFSAMLAGFAFGLPIQPIYYWMAIPVVVLVSSIPISPQGAGVMEYFAIKLLEPQGATVAQAFAICMSIRLTQIFWNLSGGYFVLRGHYRTPTQSEQKEIEAEDVDKPATSPGANLNLEPSSEA